MANRSLWADTPAYFYADAASSEGNHLDLVRQTFGRWSVSFNHWTDPLERVAAEQPASAWTAYEESHYAFVRHQPEGCSQPQAYAVRRWLGIDQLFDRYAFCACEDGSRTPKSVWGHHDQKGKRERMFAQLLTDLDLHRPPCLSLEANRAFYALAALAYNVLTALKLLELPAELSRHARGLVGCIARPAG